MRLVWVQAPGCQRVIGGPCATEEAISELSVCDVCLLRIHTLEDRRSHLVFGRHGSLRGLNHFSRSICRHSEQAIPVAHQVAPTYHHLPNPDIRIRCLRQPPPHDVARRESSTPSIEAELEQPAGIADISVDHTAANSLGSRTEPRDDHPIQAEGGDSITDALLRLGNYRQNPRAEVLESSPTVLRETIEVVADPTPPAL